MTSNENDSALIAAALKAAQTIEYLLNKGIITGAITRRPPEELIDAVKNYEANK